MQDIEPTALTLQRPADHRDFACEVAVSEAFDPDSGMEHPPPVKCVGIWDTGATGSVITKGIIDHLGLGPVDRVQVNTANGVRESDVYLVNILLPSNVGFQGLRVTEADIGEADVLIGMDVICLGDFAITHTAEGGLVMSYRTPPDFGHVTDFVKQINSRRPVERSRNERRRSGKTAKRRRKRRSH